MRDVAGGAGEEDPRPSMARAAATAEPSPASLLGVPGRDDAALDGWLCELCSDTNVVETPDDADAAEEERSAGASTTEGMAMLFLLLLLLVVVVVLYEDLAAAAAEVVVAVVSAVGGFNSFPMPPILNSLT